MSHRSRTRTGGTTKAVAVLVAAVAAVAVARADAAGSPIELVVQPQTAGRGDLAPLAAYLGAAAGREVRPVVHPTVLGHWHAIRRRAAQRFVLDEAHFTGWRVRHRGYRVLVRLPGTVAWALVARRGTLVLDPDDLAGSRIAAPAPPALAVARLLELLPDAVRAPVVVEVSDAGEALERTRSGDVRAALLSAARAGRVEDLAVVVVTEETPAPALSASPAVPEETAARVRAAALRADGTGEGRAALAAARLPAFVPAHSELYADYARLLRGVWGD